MEVGTKMSEKYGNIPDKFTKAWWEYYWEYYRWYVIVPLVIIITTNLSKLCEDVDGNGEKNLFFSQIWIDNNPDQADIEYARVMATKLQLSFGEDEKYIYIMDKEAAELYVGEIEEECPYAPLETWIKNIPEDAQLFSAHGKNYGICLSGNKFLEGYGIDLSDHYLLIRYYPRKDQLKKQLKGYEGAISLANKILAER